MKSASVRKALCAGTSIGFAALAGIAYADPPPSTPARTTELTEVVVTARKVSEPVQKAPVAVTALTQSQLTEAAVVQPNDLSYIAPSLSVTGGPNGTPGIGQDGRNTAAYNVRGLSVGGAIYFAGAPAFGVNTGQGVIYDMQDVQIVAGPQGTLFGRTSVGGAVLFEPAKPTDQFGGYLEGSAGNLGYQKVEGMANIPLIQDVLNFRISGFEETRNGYTKDLTTGQELDNEDRYSFRVGLDFKPTKWFDNSFVGQFNNVNEAGAGNVLTNYNPDYAPTAFGGLPLYNFPAFLGPTFFGGLCAAEANRNGVAAGSTAAFVAGCENQRVGILQSFGTDLASEAARIAANADGGIRATLGGGTDQTSRTRDYQLVNTSIFRAPDYGWVTGISFKNVFGFASTIPTLQDYTSLSPTTNPLLAIAAIGPGGVVLGSCNTSGANIGYCNYPVQTPTKQPSDTFQVSDEINVSAKFFNHLTLLGGLFGLRTHTGQADALGYGAYGNVFSLGLAPSTATASVAATAYSVSEETGEFINATLDLNFLLKGLSLNGAFRHSQTGSETEADSIYETGGGVPSTLNTTGERDNTHSFTIDYQVLNNVLLYFRTGTGFIPGGVNETCTAYTASNCPIHYTAETNTDYEVGIKTDYRLGPVRLRTDAAFFKDDFSNIQVSAFIPVNNNGTIVTADPTLNAAQAGFNGLELTQVAAWNGLTFNGNMSINNGRYTKYYVADGAGLPCVDPLTNAAHDCEVLNGTVFAHTPKYKVNLQLLYTLPIDRRFGVITPSAQYAFNGSESYGQDPIDSPFAIAPSYSLVNFRVDWHAVMGSAVDADFFIRNAFNKDYLTEISPLYSNALFGFNTGQYGEPRFFGFDVTYRFGALGAR